MKTQEASLENWQFTFHEAGLAPSEEIQHLAEQCKLFRPPTIIFSKNDCIITQRHAGVSLVFNAREALRFINYQARTENFVGVESAPKVNSISYLPERLHVKHAEHWKNIEKPKDIQITEINESSDSFFLTPFKGHLKGEVEIQRLKESVIPVQKLGPNNPITSYFQGSLYEDELDDNGLIQYEYKFRTMANSWFGLVRNYARVDEVAVIIMDTRVYWEAGWKKLARQFMVRKACWEQLKVKGFSFEPGWTMNPNQSHIIYPFLQETFTENEYIHFH